MAGGSPDESALQSRRNSQVPSDGQVIFWQQNKFAKLKTTKMFAQENVDILQCFYIFILDFSKICSQDFCSRLMIMTTMRTKQEALREPELYRIEKPLTLCLLVECSMFDRWFDNGGAWQQSSWLRLRIRGNFHSLSWYTSFELSRSSHLLEKLSSSFQSRHAY